MEKALRKAAPSKKNRTLLSFDLDTVECEEFVRELILDIPVGDYRYSEIISMFWEAYGHIVACSLEKSHFLGLSAISAGGRGDKIN